MSRVFLASLAWPLIQLAMALGVIGLLIWVVGVISGKTGGKPVDLLGEGEMFGHPSVLSGLPTRFEVRAREDTLAYSLPAEDVAPLLAGHSSLRFLARLSSPPHGRSQGDTLHHSCANPSQPSHDRSQ